MSLEVSALTVEEVGWGSPGRLDAESYIRAHCDPLDDLLVYADVVSGLGRLSRVWRATQGETTVGVAFAFPLWPDTPSLGLWAETPALEGQLLDSLIAMGAFTHGYVICEAARLQLYESRGRVSGHHKEAHLVRQGSAPTGVDGFGVRPGSLEELDAFYRAEGAGAWNPVQFETGPYVVITAEGRVIAAAGTHFAYPGLAQVGNVLTGAGYRGRGLALRCTAAVTDALVKRGETTLSLFVATDNAAALRVYEKLGYTPHRMLEAFSWDTRPSD